MWQPVEPFNTSSHLLSILWQLFACASVCVCTQERVIKRHFVSLIVHGFYKYLHCMPVNVHIRQLRYDKRTKSWNQSFVRWSEQAFPVTEVIRWPEMTLNAPEECWDGASAKNAATYWIRGRKKKHVKKFRDQFCIWTYNVNECCAIYKYHTAHAVVCNGIRVVEKILQSLSKSSNTTM